MSTKTKKTQTPAKKTAPKRAQSQRVARQSRPGVLDCIEQMLTGTAAPGLTIAAMVAQLRKATGRDAAGLDATVRTQLTRMRSTRNLIIVRERVGDVMHYRATKKG